MYIDTLMGCVINLLWPSDTIWRLSQHWLVMACCLIAPSQYLNQCWLFISEILWHLPQRNFRWVPWLLFCTMNLKIILLLPCLPGANQLMISNMSCRSDSKMLRWSIVSCEFLQLFRLRVYKIKVTLHKMILVVLMASLAHILSYVS